MIVEVVRGADLGPLQALATERHVWRLRLAVASFGARPLTIALAGYRRESRATPRRKWSLQAEYNAGDFAVSRRIARDEVPLPSDVVEEARRRFAEAVLAMPLEVA